MATTIQQTFTFVIIIEGNNIALLEITISVNDDPISAF
jgi:hypothetical protein